MNSGSVLWRPRRTVPVPVVSWTRYWWSNSLIQGRFDTLWSIFGLQRIEWESKEGEPEQNRTAQTRTGSEYWIGGMLGGYRESIQLETEANRSSSGKSRNFEFPNHSDIRMSKEEFQEMFWIRSIHRWSNAMEWISNVIGLFIYYW